MRKVHLDTEIHDQLGYGRFPYVTQYADGSKIDFTFWPVALLKQIASESKLPSELDIGYSVLLDKDHSTDQLQAPTHKAHVPAPPTEAEFQTLVETFSTNLPMLRNTSGAAISCHSSTASIKS